MQLIVSKGTAYSFRIPYFIKKNIPPKRGGLRRSAHRPCGSQQGGKQKRCLSYGEDLHHSSRQRWRGTKSPNHFNTGIRFARIQ